MSWKCSLPFHGGVEHWDLPPTLPTPCPHHLQTPGVEQLINPGLLTHGVSTAQYTISLHSWPDQCGRASLSTVQSTRYKEKFDAAMSELPKSLIDYFHKVIIIMNNNNYTEEWSWVGFIHLFTHKCAKMWTEQCHKACEIVQQYSYCFQVFSSVFSFQFIIVHFTACCFILCIHVF